MSDDTRIYIGDEKRFLFVGAGDAMKCFLRHFHQRAANAHEVLVVTNPRWEKSWCEFVTTSLSDLAEEYEYEYEERELISSDEFLKLIKNRKINICFVAEWGEILNKALIDHFDRRIFNFHTSKLPRYRGAGGFSWQVLFNETTVAGTIHQLTEKVDVGGIVLQDELPIEDDRIYPSSIIKSRYDLLDQRLCPNFAEMLCNQDELEVTEFDLAGSEYFPKLFTPKNGVLDFSWRVDFVESFIRAFSYPYPGASVRYGNEYYRIREASIVETKTVHPFCTGLITNITDAGLGVFVDGGIIRFERITDASGADVSFRRFRLGDRFFNTYEDLSEARMFRAPPT